MSDEKKRTDRNTTDAKPPAAEQDTAPPKPKWTEADYPETGRVAGKEVKIRYVRPGETYGHGQHLCPYENLHPQCVLVAGKTEVFTTTFYCPHPACAYSAKIARPRAAMTDPRDQEDFSARPGG